MFIFVFHGQPSHINTNKKRITVATKLMYVCRTKEVIRIGDRQSKYMIILHMGRLWVTSPCDRSSLCTKGAITCRKLCRQPHHSV